MTVTALAVGAAGSLVTGCTSGEPSQEEKQESAADELTDRLVATEKPLKKDEAQRTFQELADAMAAARNAGMSQQEILGEVLASNVRQWQKPGGVDAYLANRKAYAGTSVELPAPSSGQSDKARGAVGGSREAGSVSADEPPKTQEVVNIFANGVLNNSGPDMLQARTALSTALNQSIDDAYNLSTVTFKDTVAASQQKAKTVGENHPVPETAKLVGELAAPKFNYIKGSVDEVSGRKSLVDSLPSLWNEWNDPEAARSNTAYPILMAKGRAALKDGKPVVFISHSEGGFPVRIAKKDLDKEISDYRKANGLPPAPSPVGVLYIAPPFGDESGSTLNTDDSKYVLLNWDILEHIQGIDLPPTAYPKAGQPEGILNGVEIHLLSNYLKDGSDSRAQIIKAYKDLSGFVCKSPKAVGLKSRPGQRADCDPPAAGDVPEQTPGQSPGETPGQTPGQSPGETPGQQTPEQPPGDTPEQQTPEQPGDTPGQQTPEQPGDTPEQPPGHTPQQPQQPQQPGNSGPRADRARRAPDQHRRTIPVPWFSGRRGQGPARSGPPADLVAMVDRRATGLPSNTSSAGPSSAACE